MDLSGLITQQAANRGVVEGTVKIKRMKVSMTKFSMAAGMASMALGFFGDDVDSSKASMILMTASMVPAVLQMGIMAGEMGKVGVAGAAGAQGMTKMALAGNILASVGVAAGLGLVAYGISKIMSRSKDATDSVNELNVAMMSTTELLEKLTYEEAQELEVPASIQLNSKDGIFDQETVDLTSLSAEQMVDAISLVGSSMRELEEYRDAYAKDDPMYAYYQDRINALDIFENKITQAQRVEMGEDYIGLDGDALAKKVLEDMKAGLYGANAAESIDLGSYTYSKKGQGEYGVITTEHTRNIDSASKGLLYFNRISEDGMNHLLALGNSTKYVTENFAYMESELGDGMDDLADGFSNAEEKMRGFANAREELFFGGKSSYMSGDMMKQVVNKGVENLYSNVELVMTNNFYGLTFEQATAAISQSIVRDLIDMGVPMSNTTV